jgi:hypothetical protein
VVEESLRQSEQHSGHLLEQSRRLQEELRLLSRRILSVQEEERKRISRELHDVIAQVLTGINVRLAVLKTEAAANTKGLSRNIARTQRMVERSVDIVHRFAHDLRPAVLDHLGLIAALHAYLKIFAKETGIRVSLTASPAADRLDSTLRTTLYRVAQEALTNVARHARASRAEVVIGRHGSELWMHIRDNGCAFSVEQVLHARKRKRMGLLGMRERMEMVGGRFRVESAPGHGHHRPRPDSLCRHPSERIPRHENRRLDHRRAGRGSHGRAGRPAHAAGARGRHPGGGPGRHRARGGDAGAATAPHRGDHGHRDADAQRAGGHPADPPGRAEPGCSFSPPTATTPMWSV